MPLLRITFLCLFFAAPTYAESAKKALVPEPAYFVGNWQMQMGETITVVKEVAQDLTFHVFFHEQKDKDRVELVFEAKGTLEIIDRQLRVKITTSSNPDYMPAGTIVTDTILDLRRNQFKLTNDRGDPDETWHRMHPTEEN